MPVSSIPTLTAILIRAPICPTVLFDRSLETYLPQAAVYRGICREADSSSRHPIYLVELLRMPHSDRFLLSADGRTFFRPRVSGVDARAEPRGPVVGPQNPVLRFLDDLFPGDREKKSKRKGRNDGYRLLLFEGSGIVLTFERDEPRLWRNIRGNADPFDSNLYYPGRAPADILLAAGFSAFPQQEAQKMLEASSARFLR